MNIVTALSSSFNRLNQLIIKVRRYGKNDVQTSYQSNPFGVDSNPAGELVAVYGKTDETGKTVLLGYLQKDMIAQPGEVRLFALSGEGNVINSIHLSNAGNIFIGVEKGNQANTMVRFNQLDAGFTLLTTEVNALVTAFNAFVAIYNAHTHISNVPTFPTAVPNTPASPGVPVTAEISGASTPKIFTD